MITLLTTSISRSGKPLRAPMPRFHVSSRLLVPHKIDAKRVAHFVQAEFTGLIPQSKRDSFRLTDKPGVDRFAQHECVNQNLAARNPRILHFPQPKAIFRQLPNSFRCRFGIETPDTAISADSMAKIIVCRFCRLS
jgi:hypothetical protein